MMKKSGLMAWLLTLVLAVVSLVWMVDGAIATPLLQNSIVLAQVDVDSSRSTVPTDPSPSPDSSKTETEKTPEADASTKTPPSPEATEETEPASGGPYDVKAIEEFYKSLYGS